MLHSPPRNLLATPNIVIVKYTDSVIRLLDIIAPGAWEMLPMCPTEAGAPTILCTLQPFPHVFQTHFTTQEYNLQPMPLPP